MARSGSRGADEPPAPTVRHGHAGAAGHVGRDLVQGRAATGRSWWRAEPTRRRRLIVVLAGALVAGLALDRAADRLEQRALRDAVAVTATIGAASRSTAPGGGHVEYYLTVRNEGARPVRVDAARLDSARLRLRDRGEVGRQVPAGGSVDIALSVLLDCTGPAAPRPLAGGLTVRPDSGRRRVVPTVFAQVAPLSDVADTLCRARPDLVDRELSGPVAG